MQGVIPPEPELSLPYRGRRLFGDDLRRQIDQWVTDGIAEPGFAQAMTLLLDNPDWMDLRDVDIAVLGAGAELGPTRSLLRWGARVHAVDLPRPDMWQRLIGITRGTAGSLRIPIALDANGQPPFVVGGFVHPEDDATVAAKAGADLLTRTPELLTWIGEIDQPFVLGTYAYADGALHVLLSMAADAIATELLARRDDITLAYLATPTDVFMVPMDRGRGVTPPLGRARPERHAAEPAAAAEAVRAELQGDVRRRRRHRVRHQRLPRAAAGTQLRAGQAAAAVAGTRGPRRRRAGVAQPRAGHPHAVRRQEPGPRRGLRRGRPVRRRGLRPRHVDDADGRPARARPAQPGAAANPATPLANPMDLFAQAANHGGLWRAAYAPRSVLGIAALLGMFESKA